MEVSQATERIPAIAAAILRAGAPLEPGAADAWTVRAHEPGQSNCRAVRLQGYAQCRELATELSELGLVVLVCDPQNVGRLHLSPRPA